MLPFFSLAIVLTLLSLAEATSAHKKDVSFSRWLPVDDDFYEEDASTIPPILPAPRAYASLSRASRSSLPRHESKVTATTSNNDVANSPQAVLDDEDIPENMVLEGKFAGPHHDIFQKIFTNKANQLQIAMKHSETLHRIIRDEHSLYGQVYSQATDELCNLHEEAVKCDRDMRFDEQRISMPPFERWTDLGEAPHVRDQIKKDPRASIQEIAKSDAKDLVKHAQLMGFKVVSIDKATTSSPSREK